jgi:hypothetical protein
MKRLKRQAPPLLSGIASLLFGSVALCLFAACALEPFTASPGAVAGKTGRVVISIVAPGEAAGARTLLPEYGALTYTVTIAQDGTTVFSQTMTETSVAKDLDPGDYTLTVTACKTGTSVDFAAGSVPLPVLAGQVADVTVPLVPYQTGTGYFNYAVTLPEGMTLTRGLLALYPLSGSAASVNIDLNAGLSGMKTVLPGYYRAQLSIYGVIGGVGKFAAKTAVLHIADSFTTTAPAYTLTADDFTDIELYTVQNSTELNNALTSIRDASGTVFTVLVSADFSFPPFSLADSGYNGKTITLRGSGGIREISLSSQGSLFTVGSASVEPIFILRDITLKGRTDNNAALVKVDNGRLVMENGAVITGNTNSSNGGGVNVGSGGAFTMSGGEISGNTASGSGGGVFVDSGGIFIKQPGGIIYGMDASAALKNTASGYNYGHAVYISSDKKRSLTVGTEDFLDSTKSDAEGNWIDSLPGNSSLAESFDWLDTNAEEGGAYILMVSGNETVTPKTLSYGGKKVRLILKGDGPTSAYSLDSTGSLFTVGEGVTLELEDITLQGRSDNNVSLVWVDGGALIMNTGSKIAGNRAQQAQSEIAGGVTLKNNSFLTMNGGEISGNGFVSSAHDNSGSGGVYMDDSTFVMNSGKITGNTPTSNHSLGMAAGIFMGKNSSFTMYGGEISHNTLTYTQFNGMKVGGVIVGGGCVFTMYGGVITGNTETGPGGRGWGAGGVYVGSGSAEIAASVFTMHGGVISANRSVSHTFSAGGVCLIRDPSYPGVFIKDGGVLYGSDADPALANTTGRSNGAAVYSTADAFGASPMSRNASLYENDNFDSRNNNWE